MKRRALLFALMTASLAHADPPQVRRLDNGLTWIHRPVRHNRIAAFELFIPGGIIDESPDRSGLTHLLSAVWVKGTARRDALRIAQDLESQGAAFGVEAREDYIALGGQVILDQWPALFALFQDVLLNPAFPPDEVEKERRAVLNAIHTKDESIFDVAEERLRRELFGDHPYGRPEEGTAENVTAFTREDLVRWHAARVAPQDAVLVTVGAMPLADTERLVRGLAAAWPRSPGPARAAPARVRYPAAPRVALEVRPFEQGYYMVGYPAPPVTHADYPAVKVINALLGGGMSSPLFHVVREQGQLAYEVSSFYASRLSGSGLVLYAGTDPKNVDLAGEKIQSVVTAFVARPPSDEDLAAAKNMIRGRYLMDHQTNARLAWYLGWWQLLGHGWSYDAAYPGAVAAVTAEQVHTLARTLFSAPSATVRVRNQR